MAAAENEQERGTAQIVAVRRREGRRSAERIKHTSKFASGVSNPTKDTNYGRARFRVDSERPPPLLRFGRTTHIRFLSQCPHQRGDVDPLTGAGDVVAAIQDVLYLLQRSWRGGGLPIPA